MGKTFNMFSTSFGDSFNNYLSTFPLPFPLYLLSLTQIFDCANF